MMKKFLFFLFLLSLVIWGVLRIVRLIDFDYGCQNYLKLAADANTVEMAKPKLQRAISYLEDHNMTSGNASIIFQNPNNDVGFFYDNLKASMAELERISPDASQLEESNLLMKLRESLIDDGGQSTEVTHPYGISIYPNNVAYFVWSAISIIGMVAAGVCWWKNPW